MQIYLGHGASGSSESMRPYVNALAEYGVRAHTVPRSGRLPHPAERAAEVFRAKVGDVGKAVLGGHSYGGRVASLVAADWPAAGLILFSYPLHPPGRPEQRRISHLPAISCPILFLSGESDSFARSDLLRDAVKLLPCAELVLYPRVGHGIHRNAAAFADAIERAASFVKALPMLT
jgi:predicted alpha/beta-hydrolase family hydrolase